ncbi:MAG: YfiR family protein [Fuerstiella sp.]
MSIRMFVLWVAAVFIIGLLHPATAAAQVSQTSVIDEVREYNVKAVSVYAFSRFTVWPESSFANPNADLVIGVFGNSRIEEPLKAIAEKKKIGYRSLRIVRCVTTEDAARCHLVFVSDSIGFEEQLSMIKAIGDQSVFVVGETRGFGAAGGVANFYISGTNVKFELNRAAAEFKGLKLNAKLLSLGTAVKPSAARASETSIR